MNARRRAGTGGSVLALATFVASGCGREGGERDAASGAAPPASDAPGVFTDVTDASGVAHTYRNGEERDRFSILESLGGGVGMLDHDQDGRLDLFLTGGGEFGSGKEIRGLPSRLYRNEGDWSFRDVTSAAGLDGPLFYTHGCVVADVDDDGWPDLLVTGYGRVCLYKNARGEFADVTAAAGLAGPPPAEVFWATSAASGDVDRDGNVDLYVAHYVDWSFDNDPKCEGALGKPRDVCSPKALDPLPHQLFLGDGAGGFRDASAAAGLVRDDPVDGKGLGVLVADLDDDGWLDVYAANDTTDNFLYLNNWVPRALADLTGDQAFARERARASLARLAARGASGVQAALDAATPAETRALLEAELARGAWYGFEEVATERGVARDDNGVPNGSMGVDAADYDGSGRFSLFVANYENEAHALYRGLPNGQFHFQSRAAGIAAIQLVYVGFGTGFLDFDRDGDEDLFVSNGHVIRFPPSGRLRQRAVLLENLRQPGQEPHAVRFQEASARGGPFLQTERRGRGAALGDLDDDGRIDLVVSHLDEPVALLRNTHPNARHWLGVELRGEGCRDAIGAVLTLAAGEERLVRQVKGGGSYLSASDRRVLFGLGDATAAGTLTVRWPSGRIQTWEGLAVDRYWRLTEGVPEAEAPPPR